MAATIINLITVPLANMIVARATNGYYGGKYFAYPIAIAVIEGLVVLVEFIYYFSVFKCLNIVKINSLPIFVFYLFLLTLGANLLSYFCGYFIYPILPTIFYTVEQILQKIYR